LESWGKIKKKNSKDCNKASIAGGLGWSGKLISGSIGIISSGIYNSFCLLPL